MSERGKGGNNRYETKDWQLGMELPSRKEKHAKKTKQESRPDQHPAVAELEAAQAETAVAAAMPSRRQRHLDERDILWGPAVERDDDGDAAEAGDREEDDAIKPLAKWKAALLTLFGIVLLTVLLAWGKLSYVHHIPDHVRDRVPAYAQGEAFVVVKPWWFGPPVFDLSRYPKGERESYQIWKQRLGNYTGILEKPTVFWRLEKDIWP